MQEKIVQHYRVTLDQAKRDYQDGLLTATGLVYYAIAIMRPIGQKLRIKDIGTFIDDLGIKKSTFYRTISKLKLKDLLDWEPTEGLDVWASLSKGVASLPSSEMTLSTYEAETVTALGQSQIVDSQSQIVDSQSQIVDSQSQIVDSQSQIVDSQSQIVDSQSQIVDSQSQIVDSQSQIVDFEASKLALDKAFRSSPDITDIYQIFINSLSNGERENFLNFSRKRVDELPVKPVLTKKWIETYHQELWKQYKGTGEVKQESKPEEYAQPSDEQIKKLEEFKKLGKIKDFYSNSFGKDGTIIIDTGSEVLKWWEFFEAMDKGVG